MDNIIKAIDESSPLRRHARPGDLVVSINGHPIEDVLDYKYFSYDPVLEVVLRSAAGEELTVRVEKAEGEDLGLDFETYLMDAPRACANRCVFCFIDQLPKGMRRTLYFKDDDARLSFLMGNYITLTNLSDREIRRIIDLRVSPINVSVHATDPALRVRLLRNPRAGESVAVMRRFAAAGITMNCQIVCCPGLNDGEALERTMRDLDGLWPAVHSVSIVPVGLTKFRDGLYPLTPFTPALAAGTIAQVTAFGDRCLREHGSRVFFCGDELYLEAGLDLPPDEFYEEHTQLENGVGMIRLMETEFNSALGLSDGCGGAPFSIACGVAVAPFFEKLLYTAKKKYAMIDGRVYAVENDFFGHSITVSGLITGRDLIAQLKGKPLGRRLLISQNMLRRDELDFLDDVTLGEAARELGVPIIPVEQDGFALWDAMSGAPPVSAPPARKSEETAYYQYNQN